MRIVNFIRKEEVAKSAILRPQLQFFWCFLNIFYSLVLERSTQIMSAANHYQVDIDSFVNIDMFNSNLFLFEVISKIIIKDLVAENV